MQRTEYEYKAVYFTGAIEHTEWLNNEAVGGWRLVTEDECYHIFEREKDVFK